jgi:hypothetical protein
MNLAKEDKMRAISLLTTSLAVIAAAFLLVGCATESTGPENPAVEVGEQVTPTSDATTTSAAAAPATATPAPTTEAVKETSEQNMADLKGMTQANIEMFKRLGDTPNTPRIVNLLGQVHTDFMPMLEVTGPKEKQAIEKILKVNSEANEAVTGTTERAVQLEAVKKVLEALQAFQKELPQ